MEIRRRFRKAGRTAQSRRVDDEDQALEGARRSQRAECVVSKFAVSWSVHYLELTLGAYGRIVLRAVALRAGINAGSESASRGLRFLGCVRLRGFTTLELRILAWTRDHA